jgi:DNA-binding NtrC family response regulator
MRKQTILFVDDEEKTGKYFRRIFRDEFEIILAFDGQQALTIFLERRQEIGLVVSDQMMPGLTGLELLRKVERADPEVVRILSTAYTDSALVVDAMREGLIDYFISKPWDIESVVAILKQGAEHFEHHGRR